MGKTGKAPNYDGTRTIKEILRLLFSDIGESQKKMQQFTGGELRRTPRTEYVYIGVPLMKNYHKLTRTVPVEVIPTGGIIEDKTRVENLSVACIIRGI